MDSATTEVVVVEERQGEVGELLSPCRPHMRHEVLFRECCYFRGHGGEGEARKSRRAYCHEELLGGTKLQEVGESVRETLLGGIKYCSRCCFYGPGGRGGGGEERWHRLDTPLLHKKSSVERHQV